MAVVRRTEEVDQAGAVASEHGAEAIQNGRVGAVERRLHALLRHGHGSRRRCRRRRRFACARGLRLLLREEKQDTD